MEWQAVVLVMQILMLAVGWFLFQQAKGELSARAAETPILGEVKALQRAIKQLLADLDQTSTRASKELEAQCRHAQELADAISNQLSALKSAQTSALSLIQPESSAILPPLSLVTAARHSYTEDFNRFPIANEPVLSDIPESGSLEIVAVASSWEKRRAQVFTLSDAGQSFGSIARETGISEGEIETLLALRQQRA